MHFAYLIIGLVGGGVLGAFVMDAVWLNHEDPEE